MSSSLAQNVLSRAVSTLGGSAREGQMQMVDAVEEAFETETHLLIQAGTGTGKSLGYLIPALVYLREHPDQRIVVATATLALQAQLAEKDIPLAVQAMEQVTGSTAKTAVVKGRNNYACWMKIQDVALDGQDSLFDISDVSNPLKESSLDAQSALGAEVLTLRRWAQEQQDLHLLADRDDAPAHSSQAWAQVSISARLCLGQQHCKYASECFVERARQLAREADLVVTNHALLAIDAMNANGTLPEYDFLIVDESHELESRMTSAATQEFSSSALTKLLRRCVTWLSDDIYTDLIMLADHLDSVLIQSPLSQIADSQETLLTTVGQIRDLTRKAVTELGKNNPETAQRQAQAAMREIFEIAQRVAALEDHDVVWVCENSDGERIISVAPLTVAGLMRGQILENATTVLTSATLKLGGNFNATADMVGLRPDDPEMPWLGLDVGSPFDYSKQGIMYVATSLEEPGRDGIKPDALAEIADLVWAAQGRTLGLFSSMRAARTAAEYVRKELPELTVLCQHDAQLSELVRQFLEEPETVLFGTVSLWQGIDAPGDTCQLVIIDKIPFPRPNEPLTDARKQYMENQGRSGFHHVFVRHAALLMAQGAGRLIRRNTDQGVVAILDPRLMTKRYGNFLRNSMPNFWLTQDREVTVQALQRLQAAREKAE